MASAGVHPENTMGPVFTKREKKKLCSTLAVYAYKYYVCVRGISACVPVVVKYI